MQEDYLDEEIFRATDRSTSSNGSFEEFYYSVNLARPERFRTINLPIIFSNFKLLSHNSVAAFAKAKLFVLGYAEVPPINGIICGFCSLQVVVFFADDNLIGSKAEKTRIRTFWGFKR